MSDSRNMFVINCALVAFLSLSSHPCAAGIQNHSRIVKNSPTSEQHLETSSIVFGLARIANAVNLSMPCLSQFKLIERGILKREPWAMKVLDASGAVQPEFIWSHNYWLGSREACAAAQNPVQITLSNRLNRITRGDLIRQTAPFELDYRVVYLRHNSPWQVELKIMTDRIIHLGLCLPSSCSFADIRTVTQALLDKNIIGNVYELRPDVLYISDLKLKDSFYQRTSLKILTFVVLFTLVMILGATFLRTLERNIPSEEKSPFRGLLVFVKCFDIVENFRALFKTEESVPNSIPAINGLRSLSCIWVIIPHVPLYMYFAVSNKTFLVSYTEMMAFQYVGRATLLVDLFFAVSAFVQAHNFVKNERLLELVRKATVTENIKGWGKMLLRRYFRFAPLYFVLMVVVETFTAYAVDVSPFHIHARYDQFCSRYWWRNVFFIQNLFPLDEMCLNWTWSLSCEMQFYGLLSVLLLVYAKHPRAFRNILICGVLTSIAWAYYAGLKSQYQLSLDVVFLTTTEFYINPFVRVMPSLLGAMAGWWLAQNKDQFEMGQVTEKFVWHLSIVVFFTCVTSVFTPDSSPLQAVTLVVIGRFFFTLSVCWMLVGSATGRAVWWSRILEHKLFQHFNRLSYAIYLLNPFVIAFVFSFSQTSYRVDFLQLFVLMSGFAVVVYGLAIVFSLAFEMPYWNLSRELTGTSKKPKDA